MKQWYPLALFLLLFPVPLFSQESQPLKSFVRPDGTLSVPEGYSGTIDAKGWKMTTAPDGSPRFAPSRTTRSLRTTWD